MELLIWYLVVAVEFGLSIRGAFRATKKIQPRNKLKELLQQMIAYSDPPKGHKDPLYQSTPMDTEYAARRKAFH